MLFKIIFRGFFCVFLAFILPVGLYQGDPDSTDFQIGIHGGGGRVASVITGCSGAEDAVGSTFGDVAGEAYIKLPPNSDSPMILGVRGGYWRSDLNLLTGDIYHDDSLIPMPDYSYGYFNPCISVETEYIGMGFGTVFGRVPERFKDGQIYEAGPITGHLRIGSMRKIFFKLSFLESSPQVSGGGLYDLSVSVPMSHRFRSSFGFGLGPYYHLGFVQRNRIGISNHFALDFNWRIGWTKDVAEYGLSTGLVYRMNFGR